MSPGETVRGNNGVGLGAWSEFASQAAVADSAAFEECIKRTDPLPRVTEGKALGNQLDVQGTAAPDAG